MGFLFFLFCLDKFVMFIMLCAGFFDSDINFFKKRSQLYKALLFWIFVPFCLVVTILYLIFDMLRDKFNELENDVTLIKKESKDDSKI